MTRLPLALVLLLSGLVLAPSTTRAQAPSLDLLQGRWLLAQRDAEGQIDSAIVRATESMNVFVREIARGEIDNSLNAEEQIEIQAQGDDAVVVSIADGTRIVVSLDGRAASVQSGGTRIRAAFQGGALVVRQSTDQGARTLSIRTRGDLLTLRVRVTSQHLPEPIVYGLRFRRS